MHTIQRRDADSTARSRPASRPIDLMHLAAQSLGDKSLELEILRMYDQIVAVHFERLMLTTAVPDVLVHLHTLKAASTGVGAWSLAEHAHVMETELRAGEGVNSERIADIHMAVVEVRDFIAERIALDEAGLDDAGETLSASIG
jgi:chemotaxis protein histidine kinase CheA